MKRLFLATVLISALLLTGCFGFLKKDDNSGQKPAASEDQQTDGQGSGGSARSGQTSVPQPPSFQDGDYYLQAVAAKNAELCEKVSSSYLKERCKTKVAELSER